MSDELAFIEQILVDVGPFVQSRRADRGAMRVSSKSDPVDLITEVDQEAQQRIQRGIADRFGDDAVVAEEDGFDQLPADPDARCWILDPIDGTHNFVRGFVGGFGIAIGFAQGREVQAAGVAFPELGRTVTAARGRGAELDGEATHISELADIAQARLEIDFARPDTRRRIVDASPKLLRTAGQIRCEGSAVLGLCSVAVGSAEAYVHAGLKTWDWAAASLIVEEAGGRVTDFSGQRLRLFERATTSIVASNGRVHDQVLDLLL